MCRYPPNLNKNEIQAWVVPTPSESCDQDILFIPGPYSMETRIGSWSEGLGFESCAGCKGLDICSFCLWGFVVCKAVYGFMYLVTSWSIGDCLLVSRSQICHDSNKRRRSSFIHLNHLHYGHNYDSIIMCSGSIFKVTLWWNMAQWTGYKW